MFEITQEARDRQNAAIAAGAPAPASFGELAAGMTRAVQATGLLEAATDPGGMVEEMGRRRPAVHVAPASAGAIGGSY